MNAASTHAMPRVMASEVRRTRFAPAMSPAPSRVPTLMVEAAPMEKGHIHTKALTLMAI